MSKKTENQPVASKEAIKETNGPLISKVPIWFWILSVFALLWNLMGLSVFLMERFALDTLVAGLSDEQKALYTNIPTWVTVGFGVGVICGTLGCIGLLMRKKWAFPLFILSLIGVIAQQFYMYFLSDSIALMGGTSAMIMPMFVLIVCIGLIFFSKWCVGKGLLR